MSQVMSLAFLTGSVGAGEWVVLFVVVLIVVGPKRLPEIARKMGRTMEMFRRAADEFKDQLLNMDQESPTATQPPSAGDTSSSNPETSNYDETSGDNSEVYPDSSDYPGNEMYTPDPDLPEQTETDATSESGHDETPAVKPQEVKS